MHLNIFLSNFQIPFLDVKKTTHFFQTEILGTGVGRIMASPKMPMVTFTRLVDMLPSMV